MSVILNPPFEYSAQMVFLFILSDFESHKNSYISLLISCNRIFGTGKDMNRWISLGKNEVLISVILPKGVKNLLFQFPISFLIFAMSLKS